MKRDLSLRVNPFNITFCVFQEMGGKIRSGETYPWAADMPEAFLQLKRFTQDKFVVMGPTTFKTFSNCEYGRNFILLNPQNNCFILTKKKDFITPKEYPVHVISSLKQISNIWKATHKLEEIKHIENQKLIDLKRRQLILRKEMTTQDIYFVQSDHHLEKAIVAIGGQLLYKRILPYAENIYTFLICENFSGDTMLPPIDESLWVQNSNSYMEYPANEKNKYTLLRVVWKRKNRPVKVLV